MAYFLTARGLIDELKKYDPKTVIMVGVSEEHGVHDASEILSHAYLTADGEMITEEDITDDDNVKSMKRALIIWSAK
jgi:hypothetical protein